MSDIFKAKQNDTWVAIPALRGTDGQAAGFDTPTATAYALPSGSNPTVTVTATGPDTEKQFAFNFGIPAGQGSTPQVQSDWTQTNTDAVDYIKHKPDFYEITDLYLSDNDDVMFTIRKNGQACVSTAFSMEIYISTGGSSHSAGKYSFTTASDGKIPSLTTISGIGTVYSTYWLNDKDSTSMYINVFSSDTMTFYCSVAVTRNAVAGTVTSSTSKAVSGTAVYNYAESKSNKVTAISSSSTDSQYPSAKCVYDAIQASGGNSGVSMALIGTETTVDASDLAVGEMRIYAKYLGSRSTRTVSFTLGSGKKHCYGVLYSALQYTTASSVSFEFINAYDTPRVYLFAIVRTE